MKKSLFIALLSMFALSSANGQNLIMNPSFEKHWGGNCTNGSSVVFYDSFNVTSQFGCTIQDWIRISETPDGYWFTGHDFPANSYTKYIYPHSDSVCVGGVFFTKLTNTLREIIEGKLTKPLTANHHYQFSMYVQLFDTMHVTNAGKLVGINSFSALFTDTAITSVTDLPIQNYHPQVQINTMVTDTQHWVLLMDTFIATGGEQFVSIGNFKPDSLTQFILIDSQSNLPEAAYYFIDDVSLIDLDEVGIEEVEKNKLVVYPNPATNELHINIDNIQLNTIEVTDLVGKVVMLTKEASVLSQYLYLNSQYTVDVATLQNGIYFIKATDTNGNIYYAKFLKSSI